YDGRETAPAAARPDRFSNARTFLEAAVGGRSVGTPGVVAMLEMAHKKHGRLAWRELLQPAIRIAESGFDVSHRLREALENARFLREDAEARALYYSGGERVVNKAYAATLRALAEN